MGYEILVTLAIVLVYVIAKVIAAFIIASKKVSYKKALLIVKLFNFKLPFIK